MSGRDSEACVTEEPYGIGRVRRVQMRAGAWGGGLRGKG